MSLLLKVLMVCLAAAIAVLYVIRGARWSRTDMLTAAALLVALCGAAAAVIALGVDT